MTPDQNPDVNDDLLTNSEPSEDVEGDRSQHPAVLRQGQNIADLLGVTAPGGSPAGFVREAGGFTAKTFQMPVTEDEPFRLARTRQKKADTKYAEMFTTFDSLQYKGSGIVWAGSIEQSSQLYNAIQAYNKNHKVGDEVKRQIRTVTVPGAFDPAKKTTAINVYLSVGPNPPGVKRR